MTSDFQPLIGTALHLALTVNDLEQSTAWYRDVLGFTMEKEFERGGKITARRMTAGNVVILLGQDDGAKGLDRKKGIGISMRIITAESIDAIAARVVLAGGAFTTEPTDAPFGRFFRIADPDGFVWTVST